ncbi:MAG: sigma-54 dependent transcriptional regulator [Spongiibacteraceae bacterium]|jgi:DNA-binding NtrC family response regulator|nr:sigma-54 dependent transcriptional regulator [Spongiibacteraceae bacterium]
MQQVLFVDCERVSASLAAAMTIRGLVARCVEPGCLVNEVAGTETAALAVLDAGKCANVLGRLQHIRRQLPDCPVVILVDPAQSELAGEAMRLGAMDYLLKPFSDDQFLTLADHVMSLSEPIADLVHVSHASRQLLLLAKKAAQTAASVLITGESGTGKERLARYIHDVSPRARGPYVAVNCAAIPHALLESTLFGHTRGAFTGATQSQPGKFELADGGTLLLDEIAELPLELQAKLLRVLQERELERVGSHERRKLDVRVIAATNRDLRQLVADGRFREDLFYRLDVLPLSWPALRERREDILPLARHFLDKHSPDQLFQFDAAAAQALVTYDWPGNVRELENVVQRALIMARGLILRAEDLQLETAVTAGVESSVAELVSGRRGAEFQYVLDTLRQFDGHRERTAKALGVTTRALRYKLAAMREHGIDVNQFLARRA